MKTYTVILGGNGAECFVHQINQEQKEQLYDMGLEDDTNEVDWDELTNILDVEEWDYSDETYSGPYNNPKSLRITVMDDNDSKVWESSDEDYLQSEDDDIVNIEIENALMIEMYTKGVYKTYKLVIPEEFDPSKLSPTIIEINEEIELIDDLKYDNQVMEIVEYGDNWSKGAFFHIL